MQAELTPLEWFSSSGEGFRHVFDKPTNIEFSDKIEIIGRYERCHTPASRYSNCMN